MSGKNAAACISPAEVYPLLGVDGAVAGEDPGLDPLAEPADLQQRVRVEPPDQVREVGGHDADTDQDEWKVERRRRG
jgi:hypothetical protein